MQVIRVSSDPGFRLVRECRRHGFGNCKCAWCKCCDYLDRHPDFFKLTACFKGLQQRKEPFEIFLKNGAFKGSLIFYQSKYKMPATYEILSEVYGNDRFIAVAREMTKIHETFIVGKIPGLRKKLSNQARKASLPL